MQIRLSGHSAYRTEYHVVWATKYRRKVLNPGVRSYLERIWVRVLRRLPGVEEVEKNFQPDHVHVVLVIPPKYAVSDIVGAIKGQTASLLRKRFSWLGKVYFKENIVWSPGYFVSTIGIDEQKVINYVRYQERQDSGQAELDL